MNIKIEQSKNKITVGKQSIELTIEEMKQLRDELDKVLGRPNNIPIEYPPYKPTIIEDGPLNPERPWRDSPYPYKPTWIKDENLEKSDIKVEMDNYFVNKGIGSF